MGGKQRTKNNTKASSSANSAQLLGEKPIFGFSGSSLGVLGFAQTEEVFDSNISNEFQITLKKLSKKDPVTKIKALKDFKLLIDDADAATLKLILSIWPKYYQNLAIDSDNSVREQVQYAHQTIALKAGKALAPVLKQLVPVWIVSQWDDHYESGMLALLSFKDSFPPNKITDVLKFSKTEFFEFILKNLTYHTATTLNTPVKCTPEEAEIKYQRLVICSLKSLVFYLDKVKDVDESDLVIFLENPKFWSYSKSKDPHVKSAWFLNIQSILEHYPHLLEPYKCKIFSLVFNLITDSNLKLLGNIWGCILLLQQKNSDWILQSKFHEAPSKNLLNHINAKLPETATVICESFLPFISAFKCSSEVPENQLFIVNFLFALRNSIETQTFSKYHFEIVLNSYLECLRYLIQKSNSSEEYIEKHLVELITFSFRCEDSEKRKIIHKKVADLLNFWTSNNKQSLSDIFLKKIADQLTDLKNISTIIDFLKLLPKDSKEVINIANILVQRCKADFAHFLDPLYMMFPKLFTEEITEDSLKNLHSHINENCEEIFETIYKLSKNRNQKNHIEYIEDLIRNNSVSFGNKITLLSKLFHDETEKDSQERMIQNPIMKEIILKTSQNFDLHSDLLEKVHNTDSPIIPEPQVIQNLIQSLENKNCLRLAKFLLKFLDNSTDIFLGLFKFSLSSDSTSDILKSLGKFSKGNEVLKQCNTILVSFCENQKLDTDRVSRVVYEVFFEDSNLTLEDVFGNVDYSVEETYFFLKEALQFKLSISYLPDNFILSEPNLGTFKQMGVIELFSIGKIASKSSWTNVLYDRLLVIMKVSAVSGHIQEEISHFLKSLDSEVSEQIKDRILLNAARGDYASIKSLIFLVDLYGDFDENSFLVFFLVTCEYFLEKKSFSAYNNFLEVFFDKITLKSLTKNEVIDNEGSLLQKSVYLRLLVENRFVQNFNDVEDKNIATDVIGFITSIAENQKGQLLYNENISTIPFEKVAQTAQICRLLSSAIKNFPSELTMKNWDFIRISLSSWVLTVSKSIENITKSKVLLFTRSVLELYEKLMLFMKYEKQKSSTAVMDAMINEWENLFAKEVNIILFKTVRILVSKGFDKDLCWKEIMRASYDALKLMDFKFVFEFYRNNSNHSLDEMLDFFMDKLSTENHWIRLIASKVIKGLSVHCAASEAESVEKNESNSASFISKFTSHVIKAEASIQEYLDEFTFKVTEISEFKKIDRHVGRHYLALWECICFACSNTELRSMYCSEVEKNFAFESFLNFLIRSLPVEILKNFDNSMQFNWFHFNDIEKEDVKYGKYALYMLSNTMKTLPALVRKWWNNGHSRQKIFIDKLITNYMSVSIVKEELQEITSNNKDDTMSIVVHNSTREIIATYTLDEVSMELILTMPINYPLNGVKVEHLKQIGGKSSVRNFGMQLTKFLNHLNGSILDGLKLWKQNLDKKFQGVEECFICYTIIHQGTCALPKLSCRTCRKKFHGPCLYKWFTTSNKSTCPICRNIF